MRSIVMRSEGVLVWRAVLLLIKIGGCLLVGGWMKHTGGGGKPRGKSGSRCLCVSDRTKKKGSIFTDPL